jgi:UDP-hydrolysing UDP-N-acetyl-D-glucosamine 2-epimerase
MNKKVAIFTGTRAEYGLLYWLMKDIQSDKNLDLQILVSGMHLSPEFGETFNQIQEDGFVIDEKIEMLLSSNTAVGIAKSIGLGVLGFTDAFSRLLPDVLVVLGDRFEALAAAQTAMILRIPVLHLHGGEITEGAYDDSIRHAITKFSYLHGTSTEEHKNRVIQLGESPNRVFNVGAIGLDHILRGRFMSLEELSSSLNFKINKNYFIVTYHPATLADEDPETTYKNILDALESFKEYQVIFTYPNADDGGRNLIPLIEAYASKDPERILVIPSLGHTRYLSALKFAASVIGNSSSGIIEAPAFNIPSINIGSRQKGRAAASSVINCDIDSDAIRAAITTVLKMDFKEIHKNMPNPYGQGNASKQVIEIIKSFSYSASKNFHNIKDI